MNTMSRVVTVRERLERIYKEIELMQADDDFRKLKNLDKGRVAMVRANVVILRGEIE